MRVPTQGAVPQFEFIKQVDKFQRELTQGMRLEDGAGRMLDFFSATLGAQSFDGGALLSLISIAEDDADALLLLLRYVCSYTHSPPLDARES